MRVLAQVRLERLPVFRTAAGAFQADLVECAQVNTLDALHPENQVVRPVGEHVEIERDRQALSRLQQRGVYVSLGVAAAGRRVLRAESLRRIRAQRLADVLMLTSCTKRSPRLIFIHWATGPMGCVG